MDPAYTEPGYLVQSDADAVERLAHSVPSGGSEREVAEELFLHVRDGYVWDMRKVVGAQVLVERDATYAMSFDKSNLLAALLRARGIPSRFRFIKCTFHNDHRDRIDTSYHAPVEVHLDGEWVTADPAFGEATSAFKAVSGFGEETWEEIESERVVAALPRGFVLGYNYLFRFVHPTVRKIRRELRECQDV